MGGAFWIGGKDSINEYFTLEAFMVEWGVFIAGLKKVVTDIKADEEIVLKYILGTYLLHCFLHP